MDLTHRHTHVSRELNFMDPTRL